MPLLTAESYAGNLLVRQHIVTFDISLVMTCRCVSSARGWSGSLKSVIGPCNVPCKWGIHKSWAGSIGNVRLTALVMSVLSLASDFACCK